MILNAASSIYGAVAAARRRWYAGDSSRQRRLTRPVVSVGNLRLGGSGKTPIVASLARLLTSRGERPAILTRGYARQRVSDGVTVVSDGADLLAGIGRAGDEALMLARALPGVPVLVGADRYLSGCLAERRFGATVHLLDDGFQHLALARDLDLLVVDEDDLVDRVLPAGHLREPLAAARQADALLSSAGSKAGDRFTQLSAGSPVFHVSRSIGEARIVHGRADAAAGTPVFAVAGIARPQRFLADLAAAGWRLAGSRVFADHHVYSVADMTAIVGAARAAGATLLLTTEKDAVRMDTAAMGDLSLAVIPLTATIDAAGEAWLLARLGTRSAPG